MELPSEREWRGNSVRRPNAMLQSQMGHISSPQSTNSGRAKFVRLTVEQDRTEKRRATGYKYLLHKSEASNESISAMTPELLLKSADGQLITILSL